MLGVGVASVVLWWFVSRRVIRPAGSPRLQAAFVWGALAWLLGGALLKALLGAPLAKLNGHVPGPLYWLALGLLTGVFECGVVLLLALCVPGLRRMSWNSAVAFGIGFGALEAAVVSMDAFFPEPDLSPTHTIRLSQALTDILAPTFERVNAMPIHVFACALVLYAVRARRSSAFWAAFAYKTVIDGLPVEKLAPFGPWAMELLYVPFGIAGLIGLLLLARRWAPGVRTPLPG